MKNLLFLILCILLNIPLSAQKFTLNDIPLSLGDFTLREGYINIPHAAYFLPHFNYTYELKYTGSDTSIIFKTELNVNREKSWIRKEFLAISPPEKQQELIDHEKGHYILAMIHHRKIQQAFASYKFTSNYKREIKKLVKRCYRDWNRDNSLYDLETKHMDYYPGQKQWIEKLLQELNAMYTNDESIPLKSEIEVKIN